MTPRTARVGWITAGLVAALCGGFADRVEAQRFGRGATPDAGACFYRDINFQGDYFCVRAGEEIEALPRDMNDQISSVRTFGRGVEVTVFQDSRFNGRSARVEDMRNLRNEGWNDRISSIRVDGYNSAYGRNDRYRDDRYRDGVGASGREADRIVRRAYQDVLNREPDPEGMRVYRSRIIDEGWTEQQVRDALRTSPEHRSNVQENRTMTRERATEVVRRAYQSVLNREPDPAAEGYISQVMQGATQADVERELRRSPEYRQGRPR